MSGLPLTSAAIVPGLALNNHSSTSFKVEPANGNKLKRRRQDENISQIDSEPFEIRVSVSEIASSISQYLMSTS